MTVREILDEYLSIVCDVTLSGAFENNTGQRYLHKDTEAAVEKSGCLFMTYVICLDHL